MEKDISIVVPLQNEEENVPLFYFELKKVLDSVGRSYEIVFIDDGSQDSTYQKLYDIYQSDPCVNIVSLDRNYGQTYALAAGFEFARGEIIFTMDGDFQHDPLDIPKFLEKIDSGCRVVSGWKRKRSDNFFTRQLPSLIVGRLVGIIFGIRLHDIGSTYRAYRSGIVKGLSLYSGFHRFIPLLINKDIPICEIEVKQNKRRYGRSHYGLGRIGIVCWDIFLLCLRRRNNKEPGSAYTVKQINSHP